MRRAALAALAIVTIVVVALGCGGRHHGARAPVVAAVIPSAGIVGSSVLVIGSGFGASQGASTITLGGAALAPTSWSKSAIGFTVPAAALGGPQPVIVRVGGTSSNSLAFDVQLPSRLYVDDCGRPGGTRIYGYALDSAGAPSALAGSPWLAPFVSSAFGGDASEMVVDPVYRKLYVTGTSALGTWSVDATTGDLAQDGVPLVAGAANFGVTVSPDGLRVYVAATGSSEILGFAAGATALTPLPDSPYLSGAGLAADVPVLTRNGAFLFLNNEAHSFEGFQVQPDGSLLPLAGSPFPAFTTSASTYGLHTDGRNLYFADYNTGTVGGFSVDASTGAPAPLAGSPYPAVPNASALVPSRDARHAYATSYGGLLLASWNLGVSGAPTPMSLSSSSIPATATESSIVTSVDGQRVYVLDEGNRTILGFAVGSSGALTALPGSPFPTGIPAAAHPCTMVVTP